MYGWLFFKFNNAFVFLDPEPPIISFLYGKLPFQIALCFTFICLIIKIDHLYLLSISLSQTLNASVPYEHVVILSKVCNLLSSLLLNAILLIPSVYTLCFSLFTLVVVVV